MFKTVCPPSLASIVNTSPADAIGIVLNPHVPTVESYCCDVLFSNPDESKDGTKLYEPAERGGIVRD